MNCSCRVSMFDPKYFIQGNCLQSGVDVRPVWYKMKFQHHTKHGTVRGSSRIEEQEDGTFKPVWASKSSERLGGCYKKTKFDIVRPGRYTIIITGYYINT